LYSHRSLQCLCIILTGILFAKAEDNKTVPSSTKEEEDDEDEEEELHATDAATGPIPVGKPHRFGKKEEGGGKVELDAKKVTGKHIA
jgi:hypothetical protein